MKPIVDNPGWVYCVPTAHSLVLTTDPECPTDPVAFDKPFRGAYSTANFRPDIPDHHGMLP